MELTVDRKFKIADRIINDMSAISPEASLLVVGDYDLYEKFAENIHCLTAQVPNETYIHNEILVDVIYADSTRLELKGKAYPKLYNLLKQAGIMIVYYYDRNGLQYFMEVMNHFNTSITLLGDYTLVVRKL